MRPTPRSSKAVGAAVALTLLMSACSIGDSGSHTESAAPTASVSASATPTAPATGAVASPDRPSAQPTTTPDQGDSTGGSAPAAPGDAGYVPPETDPTALDSTVEAGGAVVSISSLDAVDAVAAGPGEVSGPAIQVEVSVTAREQEVDLAAASVELTYGDDQTPAVAFATAEQAQDLPAKVDAGKTVKGTYVFAVPTDSRDRVDVRVTVSTADPVVVFRGAVE